MKEISGSITNSPNNGSLSSRSRNFNEQTQQLNELTDRKSILLVNQSKHEVNSRTNLINGYHSQREYETARSNQS